MVIYLLLGCLTLTILKDVYLRYAIGKFEQSRASDFHPMVTVLIAARNEASTITRCINGLVKQNYPKDRLQILIGNDRSEDSTLSQIQLLAAENENVEAYDIDQLVVEGLGKMNVLVQLIDRAKGDYLLFTDADTEVNPDWVQNMVGALQDHGVVTGTTIIQATNAFERCQYLDWMQAQAMVKVLEDAGTRVTSLGNNMGVTREAYDKVGGFRGIRFSITEDYELYVAIIEAGYKPVHVFSTQCLAHTLPMRSVGDLLEQRKRWMYGVIRLPLSIIVFLVLNALFIPICIAMAFYHPWIVLAIVSVRMLILSSFVKQVLWRLEQRMSWLWLLPFEIYQCAINLLSLAYFLLPLKARWKGRPFK